MARKRNTEVTSKRAASAASMVLRNPTFQQSRQDRRRFGVGPEAQSSQAVGRLSRCGKTNRFRRLGALLSLEEAHAVTRRRMRSSCHAGATSATIR